MGLSLLFPEVPSWTLTFQHPWGFFFSWSLLARDTDIRQPWTFCAHPLTAPYTRPVSLRERGIRPWWCYAIKSHQESSKKAEAAAAPGSTLFLPVLSQCLEPWKDHFCRAGLFSELICGIYSNCFCRLSRLPVDLRTGMGEGCHSAPRIKCTEVDTARRWDVRGGPIARSSTGTAIRMQPPGTKAENFWDGWTGR